MEMGLGMSKRCETGLRGRLNRARGLRGPKTGESSEAAGLRCGGKGAGIVPPRRPLSATFSQEHRYMRSKASVAGRASGSCGGKLVTQFPRNDLV